MLEFAKKVLLNVSFDKDLFKKELRKSIKFLGKRESIVLYSWCLVNFGEKYKGIITQVFSDEQIWM